MPRDFKLLLKDILDAINKIEKYSKGLSFPRLENDDQAVDAIVRNLEIIGEAARNLPDEIKLSIAGIEWKKITGLRNILAHEYFGINKQIVWDIIQNKLLPLKSACGKMVE